MYLSYIMYKANYIIMSVRGIQFERCTISSWIRSSDFISELLLYMYPYIILIPICSGQKCTHYDFR